jgi:hypothetical protein
MEPILRSLLTWPMTVDFLKANSWGWPLSEVFHYIGVCLIVGGIGLFDLRLLGFAKQLPVKPFKQILPWGVVGFVLCTVTGLVFVTGLQANVPIEAYDALTTNRYLQLKLAFMGIAGLNLVLFNASGMNAAVGRLGPGDDAPIVAKAIAATSLFSWMAVVYFGRLIPWGL